MKIDQSVFVEEGKEIMRRAKGLSNTLFLRRFNPLFGVTPFVCFVVREKNWMIFPGTVRANPPTMVVTFLEIFCVRAYALWTSWDKRNNFHKMVMYIC